MNSAVVIALVALLLIGIYLWTLRIDRRKPGMPGRNDSAGEGYMTEEEASAIVARLEELGYYCYAEQRYLNSLKMAQVASLSNAGLLASCYDDETMLPLDYRLYRIEGELLTDAEGIIEVLESMQPVFHKMGLRFELSHRLGEAFGNPGEQQVTINGSPYLLYSQSVSKDGVFGAQRLADIVNDQLQRQNQEDRLYLINKGDDGMAVFLTDHQFQLINTVLTDEKWKPLTVNTWRRVFEVDNRQYNR